MGAGAMNLGEVIFAIWLGIICLLLALLAATALFAARAYFLHNFSTVEPDKRPR